MPRILIALIIAALGFSGLAEARSARHRATPRHRFVQVHGKRPQAHKRAMGKAAPAGAVMRAEQPAPAKPVNAPVEASPQATREASAATAPRGPTRIDFDDRLIQGQMNKSGAVYLFDRKESALRSMVHRRTSFREEIVRDVLD